MKVWWLWVVALAILAACDTEIGGTGQQPCNATTCDDQNPCTDDVCSPEGECITTPNTASCDDGVFCNGTDTCDGGLCTIHAGDPCTTGGECASTCDETLDTCNLPLGAFCSSDSNECTDDVCDGDGTCVHLNNANPCDDGLYCNGIDYCTGGACDGHAGDPCTSGADCANVCDETADSCNAPADTACATDGNPCTDDVCDGSGSCSHRANTAGCDDGVFCNGTDTCAGGACSIHAGDPCTGGGECADTCDENFDTCNLPLDTACTPDTNDCTDDVCDGDGNCTHPNNTEPCDDGFYCNGTDYCDAGACDGHAGDPCTSGTDCANVCDETGDTCNLPVDTPCTTDSNDCTDDVCDGDGTCTHPNNTAACDDGLFCNGDDTCVDGGCDVHTGDPCTGGAECADTCDEVGDSCFVPSPIGCTDTAPADCYFAQCDGSGTCDQQAALGDGDCQHDDGCCPLQCSSIDDNDCPDVAGVVDIGSGQLHTCALLTDGSVWCWGRNLYSQLGNTTTDDAAVPAQVDGLASGVSAIAVGLYHACALVSGAVKCWGYGDAWQLGNKDVADEPSPVDVVGLPDVALDIAAGVGHTCALITGGSVYCWGDNSSGQLGDTSQTARIDPTPVTGISTATAITAGRSHTCAILGDTTAVCWGYNYYGALGDNSNTLRTSPSPVSTLTGVTAISAGDIHTCAIASGAAYCWGFNYYGQVGDSTSGSTAHRNVPTPVTGLSSGVTEIDAGAYHSCAVAGGAALCWGSNSNGKLGDGTTSHRNQPVAVVGLSSGVTDISAGGSHSCAFLSGGTAQCWGDGFRGQLGDGYFSTALSPIDVTDVTSASSVTADSSHGCAVLSDNSAVCWGENGDGQLGNGSNGSTPGATAVTGLADVSVIDAGYRHVCAVAGGAAHCWGYNGLGQLGDTTQAAKNVPTPVDGLASGVTTISAGDSHSCAIVSGAVNCWGYNSTGQLGNGATSSTPVTSPAPVSSLALDATAVSAGSTHTCAILTDKSVWCWGYNFDGQIGDNSQTQRPTPVEVTALSLGADVISAGWYHTCAILTDGSAWCWGRNSNGQLGDNTIVRKLVPTPVNGLSSGVLAIAAGATHTCALLSNESVQCWGLNGSGQLGDGGTTESHVPVAVTGLSTTVEAIGVGAAHSCVAYTGGVTACFGADTVGQVSGVLRSYAHDVLTLGQP